MPEGPWLRNWCRLAQQFVGNKLEKISGTTKLIDKSKWQYFDSVQVYGKQMFIKLSQSAGGDEDHSVWLRYHFLMNGRLFVNECKPRGPKEQLPRLIFHFQERKYLAFYGGSLMIVPGPRDDTKTDILSDTFDRDAAVTAIMQQETPVCNILLDQSQFSGVGNIIKNEALYESKLHPLEIGTDISISDAESLVNEVVKFSKKWLDWELSDHSGKEKFSDHMKIYWKFQCPDGHDTKRGWFGETRLKRVTVWCPQCQVMRRHTPVHGLVHGQLPVKITDGGKHSSSNEVSNCDTDATEAYSWSDDDDTSSLDTDENIGNGVNDDDGDETETYDWREVLEREEMNVPQGGRNSHQSVEESGDGTIDTQDDVNVDDDLEILSVSDNSCIMLSD